MTMFFRCNDPIETAAQIKNAEGICSALTIVKIFVSRPQRLFTVKLLFTHTNLHKVTSIDVKK